MLDKLSLQADVLPGCGEALLVGILTQYQLCPLLSSKQNKDFGHDSVLIDTGLTPTVTALSSMELLLISSSVTKTRIRLGVYRQSFLFHKQRESFFALSKQHILLSSVETIYIFPLYVTSLLCAAL